MFIKCGSFLLILTITKIESEQAQAGTTMNQSVIVKRREKRACLILVPFFFQENLLDHSLQILPLRPNRHPLNLPSPRKRMCAQCIPTTHFFSPQMEKRTRLKAHSFGLYRQIPVRVWKVDPIRFPTCGRSFRPR